MDDLKNIFSNIYENWGFGGDESRSGPGSTLVETAKIREEIKSLITKYNIRTVVDIPCGDFNWMKEIVYRFEKYTGGDIVPTAIENNKKYENKIINFIEFDLTDDQEIPEADLLIVRDVIGHLPLELGKRAVNKIINSKCKYLLSTTWYNLHDEQYYKNHINSEVSTGRFYPVCLLSNPFNLPRPELYLEEDVVVDGHDTGVRKGLGFWDLRKLQSENNINENKMDKITELLYSLSKESKEIFVTAGKRRLKFTIDELTDEEDIIVNNPVDVDTHSEVITPNEFVKSKTTIVTGLWDLGRGNLTEGFGRSYDHYRNKFAELLKTPSNMFIYVSKADEEFIWQHRSKHNTQVKIMELEEFKTWFDFYDKVQEIRVKPEWYGQAGWLENSPQAKLEYYNPLVMSKMFLLNNASIFNPFDSKYFYWIDAGITNTVHPGYFSHDGVFENLAEYSDTLNAFLFISYPYTGGNEIHGFPRIQMQKECNDEHVNYVCRGGFFGGEKSSIHEINALYHSILSSTLNEGYMGTEESVFTIIAHKHPDLVTRFEIEENGLVWPFFEKLKNVKNLIDQTPPRPLTYKTAKNILYVLSFNSPKQFESVCRSIAESDMSFFEKSRKILINNSTDESLFTDYDLLCQQYGFEEIHRENLGVCGGRQFVAEHFNESDADFYMFFEDDMHLNNENIEPAACNNGFRRYIPNLYEKIIKIMLKEKFDFLKFSFSEFFGDNSVQWAWYNVPQQIRSEFWPNYDKLPENGIDPNAPKTEFKNIKVLDSTPYITGEIYYSNWPQIVSKEGNKRMFLDTVWARPYEQTWMSHMFQLMRKNELTGAVLLASPVTHERFEFYEGSLRKES